jgi:hypothetical protein
VFENPSQAGVRGDHSGRKPASPLRPQSSAARQYPADHLDFEKAGILFRKRLGDYDEMVAKSIPY